MFGFGKANVQNYGLWIPETESVLHFESTFPNDSPDGLGIKTDVRVQAFSDHTLRLKFENIHLYHKLNGTLDLPVGPIVSSYIVGFLKENVLVQMKRGHVKTFYVGAMEPNAVTNIKRAFLSKISTGLSVTKNTNLTIPGVGRMKEVLSSEAMTAILPLPSKTRKETSLLPTRPKNTSSG